MVSSQVQGHSLNFYCLYKSKAIWLQFHSMSHSAGQPIVERDEVWMAWSGLVWYGLCWIEFFEKKFIVWIFILRSKFFFLLNLIYSRPEVKVKLQKLGKEDDTPVSQLYAQRKMLPNNMFRQYDLSVYWKKYIP